jgi:hypothetical protein
MIPKKPKLIVKQISEELDVADTMIDDIVSFYYKQVRLNLSSLDNLKINVPGLGDFIMRKELVKKMIKKQESFKNATDSKTFSKYHNLKQSERKLEKLYAAHVKIEEFLKTKKEFKDERITKRNLEE